MAGLLSAATDKSIQYINVPEATLRTILSEQALPPVMIERLLDLYRMTRTGHLSTVTDHVEKLTGRPPISFEQFARDYQQVWK